MTAIAFMHVGADVEQATLMVRSFRKHNPHARLVQVTDEASPDIDGVGEVARFPRTHANLMLFRMQCFAQIATDEETWFLDTDMLCNRPLAFARPEIPVAVCRREFDVGAPFNPNFGGMDLSEYAGRTLGSIYPYVGCATRLLRTDFWRVCLAEMEALPAKFFNWYGDQEAIRNVVQSGRYRAAALPESLYACLPDRQPHAARAYVCHYKGARKALMLEHAEAEGLL